MSQNLVLLTTLTLAQCRHAQGYHNEAVQQVGHLLDIASTPKEQMLVLETLWQLTKDRDFAERALVLYQELQERLPRTIY